MRAWGADAARWGTVDAYGRARRARRARLVEASRVQSRRIGGRVVRMQRVVVRETKVCVVYRSWRWGLVTCIVALEGKR